MTTGPTIRLTKHRTFEAYLAMLQPRFLECGYRWQNDLANDANIACVAQAVPNNIVAPNHFHLMFVFTSMQDLTHGSLDEYIAGCIRFIHQSQQSLLLQAHCLIPVVVAEHVPAQARSALLETRPIARLQNPAAIVPAVYDLATNDVIYTKRRRNMYRFLWGRVHRRIEMLLVP